MTVGFVAIDAMVDRTGGVDDVATGQVKDRAARWAASALWLMVGLLTTSTVMLRMSPGPAPSVNPGTSQPLATWRRSCCRPSVWSSTPGICCVLMARFWRIPGKRALSGRAADALCLMELRGFEPLTPSMPYTACPGAGRCSEPSPLVQEQITPARSIPLLSL